LSKRLLESGDNIDMGQLLGISENEGLHDSSFAQQVSKISVPVSGGLSLAKIHDLTV